MTEPVRSQWSQTAPAEPAVASAIRRRLEQWLIELGVGSDLVCDIVLGVYEALANSVEHAYKSAREQGTMTITADYEGEELTVSVSDNGTWCPPTPTTDRSHGLHLANEVSDVLTVDHRPGSGTVVTASWMNPTIARGAATSSAGPS